jgi:hypothetical protein
MTYEEDFRRVVADAGLQLAELVTLDRTRSSSYRLAVVRPDGQGTAAA